MSPDRHEIEDVGDAFVSLSHYLDYSAEEQQYITQFLNQYATIFDEPQVIQLFKGNEEIIKAIKALNTFAKQYQGNKEIIQEFNEEIHALLINLNENQSSGIMF